MNDREIMQIAKAVRQAADEMYSEGDFGMAMTAELSGACGDVSIVLHSLLGEKTCFLTGGHFGEDGEDCIEGHAWLILTKSLDILDLTATQFGVEEKVYRTKADDRYQIDLSITPAAIRDHWGDAEWRGRLRRRARKLLEGK